MEAIRYVVLQFYPSHWSLINMLSIEDGKLSGVFLRDVQLNNNIAIIFLTNKPGLPAMTWYKHWLPEASMRVPHLSVL